MLWFGLAINENGAQRSNAEPRNVPSNGDRTMTPTIIEIQKRAAEVCGIRVEDLLSERRHPDYVRARHLAMYAARLMTPKSYPGIAKEFDRDHTTVMYGIRQIDQRINTDPDLYRDVRAVCSDWRRA